MPITGGIWAIPIAANIIIIDLRKEVYEYTSKPVLPAISPIARRGAAMLSLRK